MRLRFYLAVLCGSSLAGALLIAALSFGFYSWQAFVVCGSIGIIAAWPMGIWLARRIKREDPAWDHDRARPRPTRS